MKLADLGLSLDLNYETKWIISSLEGRGVRLLALDASHMDDRTTLIRPNIEQSCEAGRKCATGPPGRCCTHRVSFECRVVRSPRGEGAWYSLLSYECDSKADGQIVFEPCNLLLRVARLMGRTGERQSVGPKINRDRK